VPLGVAAKNEEGGIVYAIKATLHEWRLVLQRVKRPDRDEYMHASKIIWLAIGLVGIVAYVIHFTAYILLS
jgi:protein transport protein SEC61 subunit gamma-like protein